MFVVSLYIYKMATRRVVVCASEMAELSTSDGCRTLLINPRVIKLCKGNKLAGAQGNSIQGDDEPLAPTGAP